MEARQHRERGFRGVRKPGRRAVEEERANKGAVEEKERDSAEGPQEREEIDLRARRRGIAAERRLEM